MYLSRVRSIESPCGITLLSGFPEALPTPYQTTVLLPHPHYETRRIILSLCLPAPQKELMGNGGVNFEGTH